jgi:hypothetical protein
VKPLESETDEIVSKDIEVAAFFGKVITCRIE